MAHLPVQCVLGYRLCEVDQVGRFIIRRNQHKKILVITEHPERNCPIEQHRTYSSDIYKLSSALDKFRLFCKEWLRLSETFV